MKKVINIIHTKPKTSVFFSRLPFVLYGAIMLILHLSLQLGWGDETIFASYLEDPFSVGSLIAVLKTRYWNWTSHLIIEAVLLLLVHAPFLWRILDTVIMIWIAVALSLIFNPKKHIGVNWVIVLCVLAFPFFSMSSAGWIATTLNYSWPLAFGLLALLPIVRRLQQKSTPIWLYVLSVPALLFACNHEQMCAVMCAVCGILTLYLWLRNKQFPWFPAVQTLLCGASMLFILTCPGNSARTEDEILSWFPEFSQLSFLRKLELGYSSSMYQFVMQPNLVFTIFCVFLVIAVFIGNKKTAYRVLSCIPLTASLVFGLCYQVAAFFLPAIVGLRKQMSQIGTGIQWTEPLTWLPDIIFTVTLACILFSLWISFSDKKLSFFACYLILVGLASRMVMGFSPTVWASGNRTFIFMYFSFISVSILLFTAFGNRFFKSKKQETLTHVGIGVLTLFLAENLLTCLL